MSVTRAILRCSNERQSYTFKSRATVERTIADARYTVAYRYARKSRATGERIRAYARAAVDNYCCKTIFWNKRYCHSRHSCRFDISTTGERIRTDARYTIRYRYTRKPRAIVERPLADTRYTVGYRYACKTCAVAKCLRSNRFCSVLNSAIARDCLLDCN